MSATPVGPPGAASELTAVVAPAAGVGSGQVKLTWTAPASTGGSAITDYVIQRSGDGNTWTTITDGTSSSTGFTVDGLSNGTRYFFRVAAVNALGTGSWSAVVQATPAGTAAAPGGLTAAVAPTTGVGSGQVKLSWTAPSNNGSAITDYLIQRSVDGTTWTTVADGTSPATGFTVSELTNGTRYSFRVAAVNGIGAGPWSTTVSATPLGPPSAASSLIAAVAPTTGVGSGQVKLTWTAPSSTGGTAITDYVIQRSVDGTTWTTVADEVSSSTGLTVGDLSNGTRYSFRVAAVNAVGAGSWSAVVQATPAGTAAAPSGLTAAVAPTTGVGSGQVKITWTAPSDNGSAITDYLIQQSLDGTTWTGVDDGVSTETTLMVSGLANGTPYSFRVSAVNAIGTGSWSALVEATPRWIPAAPESVAAAVAPASGVGSGQVQLTWTAPASTGGAAIGDYVLEWSLDSTTWTTVADGVSAATGFTVGGLTNGTTYSFRVAAVNAAGAGSWSDVVAATPLGAPVAPGGVTAAVAPTAGVGSAQVKLSWAGPADVGGTAVVDYVVQRSVDGTAWTTVNDGVSTARTYRVSGLTNGTRYRFRIAARNAVGQGPWSAIVQATPRWKPAAPGGVRAAVAPAAGVGSRQVKLTWTAPSNNGAAITDYVIQRSTNGTTWTTVADGVSTARTYRVGGLTNGTRYRFRIAARNAVGQGPWSAIVQATPHAG